MNRKQKRRLKKTVKTQKGKRPENDPNSALQTASELFHSGRPDQAASILEDVRRSDPNQFDATHGLAIIYAMGGNLDAAIPLFESAVAIRPGEAEAHYNLGNALKDKGRLDEAIASYRLSLEINPNEESSFVNLGLLLMNKGELQGAADCYRRALEINPRLAIAQNNLGTILKMLGNDEEAITCFERALEIDPHFPGADIQLQGLRSDLIQFWHMAMLADDTRNDAFQRAIEKAVSPTSHVLDIGTGSGLLALMAAKAGAAKVTACEKLAPLAKVARQVVEDNGYADRITVIEKDSAYIRVGIDMERPADVLISEIVDVGLLQEGVLPTMRHAMSNLVATGASVIPKSASVEGMLVEIPGLRAINPLRSIAGFDLSAFDVFRNNYYQGVYLDHEEHRRLSDVFPVVQFDFTNLPPSAPGHDFQSRLDVETIADGNVHAVVFWFDLHLDDEIVFSTNPNNKGAHWGQALQFFEKDISVKKGQPLSIGVTWSDQQIAFSMSGD